MSHEIEESVTFTRLKDLLSLHAKPLAITAALSLLFSLVAFFLVTPRYTIVSTFYAGEQKDEQMTLSPIMMLMNNNINSTENEAVILRSRAIIENAVKALNLQFFPQRTSNNMLFYFLDRFRGIRLPYGSMILERCPEDFRDRDIKITVGREGRYRVTHPNGQEFDCEFQKDCSLPGGTLYVRQLGDIPENAHFTVTYFEMNKLLEYLAELLEVAPLDNAKDSSYISLSVESEYPYLATEIVKEVLNAYMEKKKTWAVDNANQQQKLIEKVLQDVKVELDALSEQMARYQSEKKTVLPEIQLSAIMEKLVDLDKETEGLRLKSKAIRESLQTLDRSPDEPVSVPLLLQDLSVQEAARALNSLIMEEARQKQLKTDLHPDLQKLRQSVKDAHANLRTLLLKSLDTYENGTKILEAASKEIGKGIAELPVNIMDVSSFRRRIAITEKLYAFLSEKLYETTITMNSEQRPIKILDVATPDVLKSFPRARDTLILIFFFVLFMVLNVLVVMEILRPTVDMEQDLLKYPVFSFSTQKATARDIVRVAMLHVRREPSSTPQKFLVFDLAMGGEQLIGDIKDTLASLSGGGRVRLMTFDAEGTPSAKGLMPGDSLKEGSVNEKLLHTHVFSGGVPPLLFIDTPFFRDHMRSITGGDTIFLVLGNPPSEGKIPLPPDMIFSAVFATVRFGVTRQEDIRRISDLVSESSGETKGKNGYLFLV